MTIDQPGKFEGEQEYVPYLWEQGLDGGPDFVEVGAWFGSRWGFKVTHADHTKFPQLKVGTVIWLRETDQGFVEEVR